MSNINEMKRHYWVAFYVAKSSKPHTIIENVMLLAAVDMAMIMLGKPEADKLKSISVSENIIQRRISYIATDIQIKWLKKSL